MIRATGCVSLGTDTGVALPVERVIECFLANESESRIWVDIFLHNPSGSEQSLIILHRGSLKAVNVTEESWSTGEDSGLSGGPFERSLTSRIVQLHQSFDPIQISPGGRVRVGATDYQVVSGSVAPRVMIGDNPRANVPFTMWRVGPFVSGRHILRMRLDMSPETFEAQIGRSSSFCAYGEEILLDRIQHDDLVTYDGADIEAYRQAYDQFKNGTRMVPDVFEYVVVSPDGIELPWRITTISSMIHEHRIFAPNLSATTRLFIADCAHSHEWTLQGEPYNGFVVRFTSRRAFAGVA